MHLRDRILDLIFATSSKSTFNSADQSCSEPIDVPAAVGQTIQALKKEAAITDEGVNYEWIRNSDAYTRLQSVLYPCLASFDLYTLETIDDKKAFWINLYNLLTIDAVLHFSVQQSVTEGWLGIIRFFRKAAYVVGGLRFSLEDIEHGILRGNRGLMYFPGKQFSSNDARYPHVMQNLDARVHFALNCASRSCPPIAFYAPDRLDAQLDLAAANFIDGETQLDKSGVVLHISRIFKWYRSDFGGTFGVLEWIQRYLPENDIRRQLIDHFEEKTMTIVKKYDWHLNGL